MNCCGETEKMSLDCGGQQSRRGGCDTGVQAGDHYTGSKVVRTNPTALVTRAVVS
jgi:hypothetical protein